jgi:hypothetical protein
MSGHPEREGGEGGGATLQHGNPNSSKYEIANSRFRVSEFPGPLRGSAEGRQNPDSRFHVSKCADSRILLCKFQIPSFRVSGAPPWEVRRGIPKSRFHVSSWADSRILLCKFQIPRFRVCRFQDTPGHIPDSEFPSFRGPLLGPSPRDGPQIPDSEFPSFRGPLLPLRSKAEERDSQIPDSEFPSFRGPLLGRSKTDAQIPRFQVSESNSNT